MRSQMLLMIFIFSASLVAMETYINYLPESSKPISDLDSLQDYAKSYYEYSKSYRYSNTYNKNYIPHLQIIVKKNTTDLGLMRINEIFKKVDDRLTIDSNDSTMLLDDGDIMHVFILLCGRDKNKNCEKMSKVFFNQLMINNQDLLPEYRDILINMKDTVVDYSNTIARFIRNFKRSNKEVGREIFNLKDLSDDDMYLITKKISHVNNDIERMVNNIEFLVWKDKWLQSMDIYLFFEQAIHNMKILSTIANGIINTGLIFHEGQIKETINKINDTISIVGFEPYDKIKNIEKIFQHRQFPIRSFYLLNRAVAYSLKDFANNFRAKAGLAPIPNSIFEQDKFLEKALEIDERLPNIEDVLVKKRQEREEYIKNLRISEHSEWLKDTLVVQNKKRKKTYPLFLKKTSVKCTPIIGPKPYIKQPIIISHDLGAHLKIKRGELVYRLLTESEKDTLNQLFIMDERNLTPKKIRSLAMAVYKALIDMNRAYKAAHFLKRISDARLFVHDNYNSSLTKTSLEHCLLPYLLLNIIPDHYSKDDILTKSVFLQERVLLNKVLLKGSDINQKNIADIESLLLTGEEYITDNIDSQTKRVLLINLAHAWHKLAISYEQSKGGLRNKKSTLDANRVKIIALLKRAQPFIRKEHPVTILEAYLYNFYLQQDLSLQTKTLSWQDIQDISYRAKNSNFKETNKKRVIDIISPSGKKVDEYTINKSIFHGVSNNELGDYVIVRFPCMVKDKKIPLFIHYKDTIYRTDVFGGSSLKPNVAKGEYGDFIAVSLAAADFFSHWFSSEESFWYGQRALMPETINGITKMATGPITITTIADDQRLEVLPGLIVQDGFGYIKETTAQSLLLAEPMRGHKPYFKQLTFQALQTYPAETNKPAATELLAGAIDHLKNVNFNDLSPSIKANLLLPTLAKKTAIGIPTKEFILLPHDKIWADFTASGIFVGRNPYSAPRIQVIARDMIRYCDDLKQAKVFQYTMTGMYSYGGELDSYNLGNFKRSNTVASFFKGLLMVVPDNKWPKKYIKSEVLLSSKDQKLNQLFLSEELKKMLQKREYTYNMTVALSVKQEYNSNQLIGLPPLVAEALAGDYDGDSYDIMKQDGYEHLAELIKGMQKVVMPNPKIDKTFTPRTQVGNLAKLLALRKPILQSWVGIKNRFYYLPTASKQDFAEHMAQSHMLEAWLGADWRSKAGILGQPSSLDLVVAEMQLGEKLGEDVYKTKIDSASVLERAWEYQQSLNAFGAPDSIPYNKLEKEFVAGKTIDQALESMLDRERSANIIDKAFRGLTRFFMDKETVEKDASDYISDDEH